MMDRQWDFRSEADNRLMVKTLVEELAHKIKFIFEKCNGLGEITAFLGATRNPMTRKPFKRMTMMILGSNSDFRLGMSGHEKDIFTGLVGEAAKRSNSIIAAFVSEVWTVMPRTEQEFIECQEYMVKHDSIAECPHRKEAVMLHVEHSRLTPRHQMWDAVINEVNGKRSISEFKLQDFDGIQTRFDCLLPEFEDPKVDPLEVN